MHLIILSVPAYFGRPPLEALVRWFSDLRSLIFVHLLIFNLQMTSRKTSGEIAGKANWWKRTGEGELEEENWWRKTGKSEPEETNCASWHTGSKELGKILAQKDHFEISLQEASDDRLCPENNNKNNHSILEVVNYAESSIRSALHVLNYLGWRLAGYYRVRIFKRNI